MGDPPSNPNAPKDVCGAQWLLLWTTAAYAPEGPLAKDDPRRQTLQDFFLKFPAIDGTASKPSSPSQTSTKTGGGSVPDVNSLPQCSFDDNSYAQGVRAFGPTFDAGGGRQAALTYLAAIWNTFRVPAARAAGGAAAEEVQPVDVRYKSLMARWRHGDGYL